jgi:hypothetical protein
MSSDRGLAFALTIRAILRNCQGQHRLFSFVVAVTLVFWERTFAWKRAFHTSEFSTRLVMDSGPKMNFWATLFRKASLAQVREQILSTHKH